MQHNTVEINSAWSLRNETQSRALNGDIQKEGIEDKCMFIVACHHIIDD